MRLSFLASGIAIALTAFASVDAAESSDWSVLNHYKVGGAGGWDLLAVDGDARRIFVTRGDHLMVVDADSGKVAGDVSGLSRAHGVALVPSLKRGYVSSGGDDRVVAFDLATLKTVEQIPVGGKNPDAMLYDSASNRVFAFNGRSNNVSVIDPSTDKVVAMMPVPGKPELAVSDGAGKIFFNLEDKNQIARADAKTAKVTATWSLGTCEEPTGLAIDAAHRRLFAVCANKQMVVVDAGNGHVVATVAIGDGPDGATFDPQSGIAFSSNSDGTLTLVHEDDPDHYRVVATVTTPPRSRTIALDPKTHHVILPTAEFDTAPAPTAAEPHPRAPMKADSFGLLVVGKK